MNTELNNCQDCVHSVYDEVWGEYKCKLFEHTVYILMDDSECPGYEKDKKKKVN